jgi:HTH-type transcriptional regulator, sugar sensing transcriptional regulator
LSVFESEPDSHLYKQRICLEKIQTILLKFGLTPNQAKVYLYAAKSGPKTAAEIFKALRLPRTETYFILTSLQNRGIVNGTLSTPAVYSTLPLEQTILSMINAEKEKINILSKQAEELIDLWKQIPATYFETREDEEEKMQTLLGQPQIFSKLSNMITSAKAEIRILGSAKDLSKFYHSNILDRLSKSVLDVRILVSPSKNMPSFAEMIAKKKIRLLKKDPKDNQCFVIKDQEEILMFLRNTNYPSDDIFAIWTDSQALVDSMLRLFDYSWDDADVSR